MFNDATDAKAKQNSLLDPGIDSPAGGLRCVGLSGANGALIQQIAESGEEFSLLVGVVARASVRKTPRCFAEVESRLKRGLPPAGPAIPEPLRFSSARRAAEQPMGNRQTGSSRPMRAIANFTGPGLVSTKLISIRPDTCAATGGRFAKSPCKSGMGELA